MVNFLHEKFSDDKKKSYFLIDEKDIADIRRKGKEAQSEYPIEGSSKLHLVAANPNGEWLTKVVVKSNDEQILSLSFDLDGEGDDDSNDLSPAEIFDVMEEDDAMDLQSSIKFDFLADGSFVALFSPSHRIEQFYLVGVLEKGFADEIIEDNHGHVIHAGMYYMKGRFYEKIGKEAKIYVEYRKSKNFEEVLVHINEICSVNVDFDGCKMSKEDYVSICQDIF